MYFRKGVIMGKIMEVIFCVFYLLFTLIVGFKILRNGRNHKQIRLWGIMTLVLVFGDSFHLIPRILSVVSPLNDYTAALGIGKMVTSITMTFFYLLLYFIFEKRYEEKNISIIRIVVILLSIIRITICLLPQNDWTGSDPVNWGIYRNIPFVILGIVMIVRCFKKRDDKYYKWLWLAILLSFLFYIPVVLWSDVSPMIGMLMLPKTCMYMWIVVMGYKQSKDIKIK